MGSKLLKSVVAGASLAAALALAPAAFAKDWKTVVIGMEGAYEPWNLTDFERQDRRLRARSGDGPLQARRRRVQDHRPGLGRHDPRPESGQVRRHHGRHGGHRRAQEGDRFLEALRGFAGLVPRAEGQPARQDDRRRHAHQSRQGPRRRRSGDQVRAGGAQGQDGRRAGLDHPRQLRRPVSEGHRDRQGIQDHRRPRPRPQVRPPRRGARGSIRPTRRRPRSRTPRTSPSSGRSSSAACSGSARAWASARATRI